MKQLILLLLALLFIACESTTENRELVRVSKGYVILNQGKISSIDYYDLESDSLKKGVFQAANAGTTLAGYAESITVSDKYIVVTIQGTYNTGENGKVIFLDHTFKQVGEITDYPSNHNTLNTLFLDQSLVVSYRSATGYTLRKYTLAESNGSVTATQEGSDLALSFKGFGYGPLKHLDRNIYIKGPKVIDVVSASSWSLTKSIGLPKSIKELAVVNNQIVASVFHTTQVTTDSVKIEKGGLYFVSPTAVKDSLIADHAYHKLYADGNTLYGIQWSGAGKQGQWSTKWNVTTKMVEISGKTETELFTDASLSGLSGGYVHFSYDKKNDTFLLTNGDYSAPKLNYVSKTGSVKKTTEHASQVVDVKIIEK